MRGQVDVAGVAGGIGVGADSFGLVGHIVSIIISRMVGWEM